MKAAAIILAAFVCRVLGKVAVAGVNIAGCDFGINTWVSIEPPAPWLPKEVSEFNVGCVDWQQ